MITFVGAAQPLTRDGLRAAANILGTDAATVLAIIDVETAGCGFLHTRQPAILYERHVFHRETGGRWTAEYPDLSSPTPGGYGLAGAAQYDRLERAADLDRLAAMRSTSWGIGQIMGSNHILAGYGTVEEMISVFCDSEDEQLAAVARFCVRAKLDDELRRKDWAAFARGYNGVRYAKNAYDQKLALAYDRHNRAQSIDFDVRDLQVRLMFAGLYKGRVDGVDGPKTREAEARAAKYGVAA